MTDPPTQTASDICSCHVRARFYHIITEIDKALRHARLTTLSCCKIKLRSWLASYGTSNGYYVKGKNLKVFWAQSEINIDSRKPSFVSRVKPYPTGESLYTQGI